MSSYCDVRMVIAIDGPAGAGKSTVARAVAERLGFTYLDTGAMYRCVGLAVSENGGPAGETAERITIDLGERVLLDGRDVTEAIRTAEASEAASHVASDPAVRAALVRKQQAIVATGDWVAEGRDIATVVAPDAAVKVFLHADPDRARAPPRGRARRCPTSRCWSSSASATIATTPPAARRSSPRTTPSRSTPPG